MQIQIESVERHGNLWHMYQTITADDGSTRRHLQVFPLDTLEWRAAEYGIDPKDTATLLDVVVAEAHLTEQDWAIGSRLHTAPDIATARRDHLARCAQVKLRNRISTRGPAGDVVKQVHADSPMHPEALALKASHVAKQRDAIVAQTAAQAAQTPIQEEQARLERLRRTIGQGEGAA